MTRTILSAAAALTLTGSYGIAKDELLCEEAVQRLSDCCPYFDPDRFVCSHGSGCDREDRPDIAQAASQCIRSAHCDDLVVEGACDNPNTIRCP